MKEQKQGLGRRRGFKTGIEIYNATNGHYPENLEVVTKERDPRGRPYVYKLTKEGFMLFSSGSDGIEGAEASFPWWT